MRGSLRGRPRGSWWPLITFLAVGPLRLPTVGVVLLMAALSLGAALVGAGAAGPRDRSPENAATRGDR